MTTLSVGQIDSTALRFRNRQGSAFRSWQNSNAAVAAPRDNHGEIGVGLLALLGDSGNQEHLDVLDTAAAGAPNHLGGTVSFAYDGFRIDTSA